MNKIKCDAINYRKGFIEISEEIHDGCINLEVWNISPDTDISFSDSSFSSLPDEAFIGNVEIELNIENAECLLKALERALINLKKESRGQPEPPPV